MLTELYLSVSLSHSLMRSLTRPISSEFNGDFQNEVDNTDFQHHQKKNDLKWYSEAYVKYKTTLRK